MNVGDRVRIKIAQPERWVSGAVKALDNLEGTIELIHPPPHRKGDIPILVAFDTPVPAWHANSLSHRAFHFAAEDLTVIKGKV